MSDKTILPVDSEARKGIPIVSGVMRYFPSALAEVAKLSKYGNDKHNPGQPLHWSRFKSDDHLECIGRHLLEIHEVDPASGFSAAVMLAWRALAYLQLQCEQNGAPVAPGAWLTPEGNINANGTEKAA